MTTFLLDIEGTTTPIDFVYKVLFPCAFARIPDIEFNQELRENLTAEYEQDIKEGNHPDPLFSPYLHWLMKIDRKSTALKEVQGRIWEESYKKGEIKGALFPDVKEFFEKIRGSGHSLAIFSSGSILAQKLLFTFSEEGDLSPFISAFFDTTTGPKREKESYIKIAHSLGTQPNQVHFISDIQEELFAASEAGMAATLSVRPGNKPQTSWNGAHTSHFPSLLLP